MARNVLDSYKSISVCGFNYCHSDCVVSDAYGDIIFASILGYSSTIKVIAKTMKENKQHSVFFDGYYFTDGKNYNIMTKKTDMSDYMHMIAYAKDSYVIDRHNIETYTSYIFCSSTDELEEKIYDVLVKYSSIPILREWMPYILKELDKDDCSILSEMNVYQYKANANAPDLLCYRLSASRHNMLSIVQKGLENKEITIDGSNEHSLALDTCEGIDSYLQLFGEGLAKKIQESFRPKFIPGEDKYDNYLVNIDDYVYHNAGINLYEAQRSAIQAIVNNMNTQNNTFLVGEMGAGKTLMASAACYVHNSNKNKGFNALVMCPSHLVENWKNEVARFIPNGKSYIVHNLEELLELEEKLRDPYKVENSFVILSKECAKIGYGNRPAVLLRKFGYYTNEVGRTVLARNVFVCPECGQVLTKKVKVPIHPNSSRKVDRTVPLELTDFTKESVINTTCSNRVRYYNRKEEAWMFKPCENKLWTAINRDDEDTNWVKLGKEGWVHIDTIEPLVDYFMDEHKPENKKEADFFAALTEQYNNIKREGKIINRFKGTKKYPVSKYVKKRLNRVFDYGIFDESQSYKGKTEQGHAFHILAQSCGKTINCTGTLMNGYVNSMYYLLYRLFPKSMQNEGYRYEDEAEFNRIFGVYSTTNVRNENRIRRGNMKLLPGISSLVFTKFLLNNTVFVSLEDMTEGLPNYTEIPYGVRMDAQTESTYRSYERFVSQSISGGRAYSENRKYVRQFCKHMLTLPDALYCMEDEVNDEEQLMFAMPSIDEYETNKDKALLDIVNAKVTAGEKVLVYYNDVGTTNLGDHIRLYLNGYGFKANELKANIKAEKREQYINNLVKTGTNVLICNPSLVETGLNLLDFTTIVFYQLGYNLNTMRQASRRSWRLSQDKDITVYFLYYQDTTQEATLSLMATKLHAAQSMEGKFSEEGLRAMSDNQDVLTKIASNVVEGIKDTVDQSLFKSSAFVKQTANTTKAHDRTPEIISVPVDEKGRRNAPSIFKAKRKPFIDKKILDLFK